MQLGGFMEKHLHMAGGQVSREFSHIDQNRLSTGLPTLQSHGSIGFLCLSCHHGHAGVGSVEGFLSGENILGMMSALSYAPACLLCMQGMQMLSQYGRIYSGVAV